MTQTSSCLAASIVMLTQRSVAYVILVSIAKFSVNAVKIVCLKSGFPSMVRNVHRAVHTPILCFRNHSSVKAEKGIHPEIPCVCHSTPRSEMADTFRPMSLFHKPINGKNRAANDTQHGDDINTIATRSLFSGWPKSMFISYKHNP